jgi:hypothetical protein
LQINEIALRSASVFKGLGDIVPTRFKERALSWWYSLEDNHRLKVSANWDSLKDEIRTYWMNQAWIERTQRKALRARYREPGNSTESPTEYYIRKYELISLVYNFTPSQIMMEVLQRAPRLWSTILNPQNYSTLAEFQTAIKYHEDLLIEFGEKYDKAARSDKYPQARTYRVDSKPQGKDRSKSDKDRSRFKPKPARTYAIGSNNPPKPTYPKDDSTVSKPKTPADYKARGCIFCGSTMHWDRDCKHNKDKATRSARTMFVDTECSSDDILAELEYEQCYEESLQATTVSPDSENEDPQEENASDSQPTADESEGSDF